jgi:hypothetical protein
MGHFEDGIAIFVVFVFVYRANVTRTPVAASSG